MDRYAHMVAFHHKILLRDCPYADDGDCFQEYED